MKAAVALWPGSNCDRDALRALSLAGWKTTTLWHDESRLPAGLDLILLPGGFSHGDYLRCGAVAARSPLLDAVRGFVARGGLVLGICNGFQILTEAGLLPGALVPNAGGKFLCKDVKLRVDAASPFTSLYAEGEVVTFPIAHNDGRYVADEETLKRLSGEGRVAFRYAEGAPNGAMDDIAGVLSENKRVLGLMPHPERACDPVLGGTDGARIWLGLEKFLEGEKR